MDKQAAYAVGKQIQRVRKEAGFNQKELSEFVGISRTSIVNIESGVVSATLENLYKIAESLNVSIHKLIPENKKPKILLKRQKGGNL